MGPLTSVSQAGTTTPSAQNYGSRLPEEAGWGLPGGLRPGPRPPLPPSLGGHSLTSSAEQPEPQPQAPALGPRGVGGFLILLGEEAGGGRQITAWGARGASRLPLCRPQGPSQGASRRERGNGGLRAGGWPSLGPPQRPGAWLSAHLGQQPPGQGSPSCRKRGALFSHQPFSSGCRRLSASLSLPGPRLCQQGVEPTPRAQGSRHTCACIYVHTGMCVCTRTR